MSGYLGNLNSFDYKEQKWDIFYNRLKHFFVVNKITENKKSVLFTYLSDDTYVLARNLVHPRDLETITFEDIVKALSDHFTPKRSNFADRANFYGAMKASGESMEEWLVRLRGLAVHCEFGAALDTVLRDRFILGLPDGPGRNKLFEQDAASLTVSRALELAQQVACVQQARYATGGDATAAEPACKVEPVFRVSGRAQGAREPRGPSTPAPRQHPPGQSVSACEVCGLKSHRANRCRYKNYTCQTCGKKGHLKKVCSERLRQIYNISKAAAGNESSGEDCEECKLFNLSENEDAIQPVASMPNVNRYGINQLIPVLTDLIHKGLQSILIFGIIDTLPKDATGSNADSPSNPVIKALRKLRAAFPSLLLAADVCLCPYTSHGHCGVLIDAGVIDHAASVVRIAEIATAYALAGAHIVAPSDMMDNRIKAIKDSLISLKLQNQVSVLSYSCKFASSMYGPFRDTMKSSPMEGDRKCYQLPPGSAGLAARAAARDVAEGADFLMVKPGLPYLDIVRQTKDMFPHHPLFIYQVSGEYAMIARSGDSSEVASMLFETLTCMRRAGADCIITYFAPLILSLMNKKRNFKPLPLKANRQ